LETKKLTNPGKSDPTENLRRIDVAKTTKKQLKTYFSQWLCLRQVPERRICGAREEKMSA